MSQIWQEDAVIPVTEVLVHENTDALDSLEAGTKVTMVGKSKGRGFQGVVKRHGFSGGSKSHGTKHTHRTTGSIGSTGPQRVMPGKKMPGRMGNDRITLKNVRVVLINKENNQILVKGAIPGMRGSAVEIIV